MLAGIRTVLFDLDGTLIDSKELILSSYRHTMRRHRGESPPDSEWLATMGTPLLSQLRAFARDEREAREMMATYVEHNHRLHDRMVRPYAGIRQALSRLSEGGFRLGIVTSKRREGTEMGLRACGLRESWFSVIVTADDVTRHKPDPDPVLAALEGLGMERAGEAVYVGDSVHDMRAGRAAGVRTAAALWGPYSREELSPASPDVWLEEVEELTELLGAREPTAPPGAEGP